MKKTSTTSMILLLLLLSLCSCKPNGDTPDLCHSELDQQALFQNLADQLIIPRYMDFQHAVANLLGQTEIFSASPNLAMLHSLQNAFKTAYVSWQYVAQYEFGPAEDLNIRNLVNHFPADVALIQANIEAGKTSFSQAEAFDRGLPALDYLLFGLGGDDAEILAKYVNGTPQKTYYLEYLRHLVIDIETNINAVVNQWTNANDAYRENFIANTGTAAGSALSLLINGLNEHYEMIRRDKIGIPVGALTLGFPNPDKVEAPYAGISAELALTATQAAKELYLGQGKDGINREGLDDYLQQISEKEEGLALHQNIKQQFDLAIAALTGLADPLSGTIISEQAKVESAYAEIVKQVVNIKTDMPSLLCIAITYVDNPSDSD
ncbi:MAG: imelysin family protein [Saprospiraceae bacterium]